MNEPKTSSRPKKREPLKSLFSEPEGLKETTLTSADGTPLLVLFYTTDKNGAPQSIHTITPSKGNTLVIDNSGYTIKTQPDGAGNYTLFHIPRGQDPDYKTWKIRKSKRNIQTDKMRANALDFFFSLASFCINPISMGVAFILGLVLFFGAGLSLWWALAPTGIPIILIVTMVLLNKGWRVAGAGTLGSIFLLSGFAYIALCVITGIVISLS